MKERKEQERKGRRRRSRRRRKRGSRLQDYSKSGKFLVFVKTLFFSISSITFLVKVARVLKFFVF